MKIVIGLTEHIGDIVACEPVARYLRLRHPEASLTWVVQRPFRELVDSNPSIDETIVVDCLTDWIKLSKHGAYDLIVDLHVNYRICQCCRIPLVKEGGNPFVNVYEWFDYGSILEAFCLGAGLPKLSAPPRMYVGPRQREAVDRLGLPERYCVIHRTSNSLEKDWSDANWRKLCGKLAGEDLAIVEVGAGRGAEALDVDGPYVSLLNRTTLLETAEVIRRATLFVGIDSGPAHFANAMMTPGVVLLGRLGYFKDYNPFSGFYASASSFVRLVRNLTGPACELEFAPVLEACIYVVRGLAIRQPTQPATVAARELDEAMALHRERVLKSGLFDPAWYSLVNPDVEASGLDPLTHYIQIGAKAMKSPGPEFDAAWYASANADVAAARLDPLTHFLDFGAAEGRPGRRSNIPPSQRRLEQLRSEQMVSRPSAPSLLAPLPDGLEHEPGSQQEETRLEPAECPLVLAFYLAQFHPIQENNWAHGMGFTEWTNVIKAKPLFRGHDQPRQPGELGYYDLRSSEVMRQQLALALQHGISGFCFYYYYFEGKKILYQPVENYIRSDATAPFCFLWANENWTKRWDGGDREIIIQQNHSDHDDRLFIADLIDTFRDPRYIKIGGKPLLLVYKPYLFADVRQTTDLWREEILRHGFPGLYLVMVDDWYQDLHHPRDSGFDATYEIPSNIVHDEFLVDNPEDYDLEPGFSGRLVDYRKFAGFHAARPHPMYKRFRTVMAPWDNTPRYASNAMVQVNTDSGSFGTWLTQAYLDTYKRFPAGERIMFVHSWNEWCEGTYIEPDGRIGRKRLEEVRSAIEDAKWLIGALDGEEDRTRALVKLQRLSFEKEAGAFRILQIARALSLHLRDEVEHLRHEAGKLRKELDVRGGTWTEEVGSYEQERTELRTELEGYQLHASNLQSEWEMAVEHADELDKALSAAREQLDALQRSASWRFSKPIRAVSGLVRGRGSNGR